MRMGLFFFIIILFVSPVSATAREFQEIHIKLPETVLGETGKVCIKTRFWGPDSAVSGDTNHGQTASDTACHLLQIPHGYYRLYSTWKERDLSQIPNLDRSSILLHKALIPLDGNGGWSMPAECPVHLSESKEGTADAWYADQASNPVVMTVAGKWYMYTQFQIPAGMPIDIECGSMVQQKAGMDISRIMLSTSQDGFNWVCMNTRGVITHIDHPASTAFFHPVVIYVPWDHYGDGKNWWMYVSASVDGGPVQNYRIRSNNPQAFNWTHRKALSFPGGANGQVTYIESAPGGPLFMSFSHASGTQPSHPGRLVPITGFSRDGMEWYSGSEDHLFELAGSDDPVNTDCFSPALSTVNGQGEMPFSGDGHYYALYAAMTTGGSNTADPVSNPQIGFGDFVIEFTPEERSVWRVKPGGHGDGKTWENAFGKIGDAVDAAVAGDQIWVASGTYAEVIDLTKSISVLGGFNGTEELRNQAKWGANPTFIDSIDSDPPPSSLISVHTGGTELSGLRVLGNSDHNKTVVLSYNSVTSASITNFTIQGQYRRGIDAITSTITLQGVYLAGLSGEGLKVQSSSVSVDRTRLFGNQGRGIESVYSTLQLKNCIIHNNQADYCAALYLRNSNLSLVNSTITANTSTAGAAIGSISSTLDLVNTILWNPGDELKTEGGSLKLNYCDIEGGHPGIGNINTDPLFTDMVHQDYHIQDQSPCIGKGIGPGRDSRVPQNDIDNNPRKGESCDIGFDELKKKRKNKE